MIVVRWILIACITCACAGASLAQRPSIPSAIRLPGWTQPHRLFTFSRIIFDVDGGMWSDGWRYERLADCSNEQMHCLSSAAFTIALPRRCADLAANRWRVGDVRTELLLRYVDSGPPPHGGGSATTLYLGDASHPNVLFAYDLNLGLTGIYWDQGGRFDFAAMARESRLEDWLYSPANLATRQRFYFPRTTFQTVGACR